MGHSIEHPAVPDWLARRSRSLAGIAFTSAASALALPGPTGDPAGIAAILVIGALAVLAGHGWAVMVVAFADLVLFASLVAAFTAAPEGFGSALSIASLALSVPGALTFFLAGPGFVAWLARSTTPRAHILGGAAARALAVVLLAAPWLSAQQGGVPLADRAAARLSAWSAERAQPDRAGEIAAQPSAELGDGHGKPRALGDDRDLTDGEIEPLLGETVDPGLWAPVADEATARCLAEQEARGVRDECHRQAPLADVVSGA